MTLNFGGGSNFAGQVLTVQLIDGNVLLESGVCWVWGGVLELEAKGGKDYGTYHGG